MMALPVGLSIASLAGLMFLAIGLLHQIIGLATPEWSVSKSSTSVHVGLWEACDEDGCEQYLRSYKTDDSRCSLQLGTAGLSFISLMIFSLYIEKKSANHEACETFALLGMVAAIIALAIGLLHFLLAILGKSQNKFIRHFVLGAGVSALFLVTICVIIWSSSVHDPRSQEIGYSFILSIVGGVFVTAGGVLIYLGARQVEE